MAIDLGTSNTTRYYTTDDHSTWDIPASTDFTLYGAVYPQSNGDTKYWFSNGDYQAANALNMVAYEGAISTVGFAVAYPGGETLWGNGSVTLDKYYIHYASRRSGVLYCGATEMGSGVGLISAEGTGASYTSAINPTGLLNIGRRQDGNTGRYWQGRIDRFGMNIGYGATLTDMEAIAGGTLPAASALGSNGNLIERANFTSSTPATITGVGAGRTYTRVGSAYGTNETSPFGSGPTSKGINILLYDGATALTSLSNIQVLAFDVAEPGDAATIINLGKTNTTNGSGNLIVATPTSTRAIGQEVFVAAYQLDGTDHRDSRQHMTKTTLVDIS